MNEALSTVEDAIVSVKEISNRLSPGILTRFGLETAILSYIKKLGSFGNINIDTDIKLPGRIKPEIETMLYRVAVEAINNALKYANPNKIHIGIKMDETELLAVFGDDGCGFDVKEILARKSGNGLFNMQNRVETYEGHFTISSNPGRGTEIKIAIPAIKFMLKQTDNE
ncbi:MAG: hypothetical protein HC830_07065 [Bacteroidetes bacterium]|nr:hypothetical protein [Bacteroidota bacterium]